LIGFDNGLLRLVAMYLAPFAIASVLLAPGHALSTHRALRRFAFKLHFVVAICFTRYSRWRPCMRY